MSESSSSYESNPQKATPGPSSQSSALRAETPPAMPLDEEPTVISSSPLADVPQFKPGLNANELGKKLLNEKLGHFVLKEFIGGGGMGVVFRALDTMLNRTVAVKVLSHSHTSDEETHRRFRNEAQSAARLDHENIARVYYVGTDRGLHYIVFEHIEGINLRDLVNQRGRLPLEEAISYTIQVSDALTHASERDVVHRDIKPSNILIASGQRAKLVDMGLARLHQVEEDNDLTQSGVTLGTFDYISPEQALDPRTADVRSDLYSLGCTFYFMLTGRPPFPGGTAFQKVAKHQGDHAPDPRELRPELPVEVSKVIARLLSKQPKDRYQTPEELIRDLGILADQYGMQLSATGSSVNVSTARPSWEVSQPLKEKPWMQHLPWLAPLGLLPICVLLINSFWTGSVEPVTLPPIRAAAHDEQASTEKSSAADQDSTSQGTSPESKAASDSGSSPGGDAEPNGTSRPSSLPDGSSEKTTSENNSRDKLPGSAEPSPSVKPESDSGNQPGDTSSSESNTTEPASSPEKPLLPASGSPLDIPADASLPTPAQDSTAIATDPAGVSPGQPPEPEAEDDASRAMPPIRSGVLVVNPNDSEQGFASLRQALAEAKNGDVIELRFNGELVEQPLLLSNLQVTLRAAEGFQPRIVFRPGPNDADPIKYPRSMLRIVGGNLTLVGVQLQLDVPLNISAESWSLLEPVGAESVQLKRCWLTIVNATQAGGTAHQGIAFVNIKSPATTKAMEIDGMGMADHPVTLSLENCVVRGEATFLQSLELQAVDLEWNNGLLVTTERMIALQSGQTPMSKTRQLRVSLQHVTAVLGKGLLQSFSSGVAPFQLLVDIEATGCLFYSPNSVPLIDHPGLDESESREKILIWNGDRNFYSGFRSLWEFPAGDGESTEQFDLATWRQYWGTTDQGSENMPHQGNIPWKQPRQVARHVNKQTIDDYFLTKEAQEMPEFDASDGTDVGMHADTLLWLDAAANRAGSADNSPYSVSSPATAGEASESTAAP